MPASPLHVGGFPVEELLGVALVSAAPAFALVVLHLKDRVRRIRRTLSRSDRLRSP
jgi:hypothetical protein